MKLSATVIELGEKLLAIPSVTKALGHGCGVVSKSDAP
jgi:hypothetical protein